MDRNSLRKSKYHYRVKWLLHCVALGVLAIYFPYLVQGVAFILTGFSAEVLSYANHSLTHQLTLLVLALALTVCVTEYRVLKDRHLLQEVHEHDSSFAETLAEVSRERGVRPPTLLIIPQKFDSLIAGATDTLLSRPMVVVSEKVIDILDAREERYVAAHELAHIRNWDPILRYLLVSGRVTISWQCISLGFQAGAGMMNGHVSIVLLFLVSAILMRCLYIKMTMSHSRTCEHLADIGAVESIGFNDREFLISGILKLQSTAYGKSYGSFLLKPSRWWHTHPSTEERARVIGVTVHMQNMDDVILDDTKFRTPTHVK